MNNFRSQLVITLAFLPWVVMLPFILVEVLTGHHFFPSK